MTSSKGGKDCKGEFEDVVHCDGEEGHYCGSDGVGYRVVGPDAIIAGHGRNGEGLG
jgi:hypothetical protein